MDNKLVHECRSNVKSIHGVIKVESREECNNVLWSEHEFHPIAENEKTETHLICPQSSNKRKERILDPSNFEDGSLQLLENLRF